MSLDNEELVGTVYEIYVTPRWGEPVALKYAADLPAVPPSPGAMIPDIDLWRRR